MLLEPKRLGSGLVYVQAAVTRNTCLLGRGRLSLYATILWYFTRDLTPALPAVIRRSEIKVINSPPIYPDAPA